MQNREEKSALLSLAARESEEFAVRFVYTDRTGVRTRRFASLISVDQLRFKAYCLCREEPRSFIIDMCDEIVLVHSWDVVAPSPIEVLS